MFLLREVARPEILQNTFRNGVDIVEVRAEEEEEEEEGSEGVSSSAINTETLQKYAFFCRKGSGFVVNQEENVCKWVEVFKYTAPIVISHFFKARGISISHKVAKQVVGSIPHPTVSIATYPSPLSNFYILKSSPLYPVMYCC